MTRIIEGTIIFFIVLALFFGTVIYVVPKMVDLNDYKSEISALVKEKTGRELTIEGNIELSLFPWIGADIGKVSFGNAEGFGTEPFVELEKMEVAVKLMPLLNKEVEVETVTVKGLNLNLMKSAAGSTNWEDLAGTKEPKADEATDTKPKTGKAVAAEGFALAAFSVGGVVVEESNLTWRDDSSGLVASVRDVFLKTGVVTAGKPIDIAVSFDLASNKPDVTGFVSLKTQLSLNDDLTFDKLTGTQVQSNVTFRDNGTGQVVFLKNFDFKAGPIALGKSLDINVAFYLENNKPDVKGNVSLDTKLFLNETFTLVKLTGTNIATKLQGGVVPGGNVAFTFKGDAVADIEKQTFFLEPMQASVYNINLNGHVKGTKIIDAPSLTGKVTVDAFDPKALLKSLAIAAPKTSDPKALTKLGVIADFTATKNSLAVPILWVKLDDTTLSGKAGVNNFAKPAITYDLKVDRMNVDRYLPPEGPSSKAKPATKATAKNKTSAQKIELPLKEIRALDINGTLKADQVTAKKINMSDILVTLTAKDGLIKLKPVKMHVFKGSYDGVVRFDARKDTPVTMIKTNVKNINIEQVLKEVADKDILSGTANLKSRIKFKGVEPDSIKRTLNGKANFRFKDGQVKGFNIPGMIRKAKATVSVMTGNVVGAIQGLVTGELSNLGKNTVEKEEDESMDFSEISGSAVITNGNVINKDLLMKSPLLRVKGAGSTSLPKETIDYQIQAKIVGSLEGQGGKDDLTGLTVPVKISGTYTKPEWKVDTSTIQQQLQKKSKGKAGKSQAPTKSPVDQMPKEMQEIIKQTPLKDIFGM